MHSLELFSFPNMPRASISILINTQKDTWYFAIFINDY